MDSSFGILLDYIASSSRPDQHRISYQRLPHKNTKFIYHSEWEFEAGISMINEFDPKEPI
jgi:hypothetical protein